jgi:hypothetical protein
MITRRQKCFERWDEQFDEIFEAAWRLSASGRGLDELMREFGIHPREEKWFVEWMNSRNGHPPMTPAMRRHTAAHEAAHAVASEILLPGSVTRAACYVEQRPNTNFGKDGHPHAQTRYLRGKVDYDEAVCGALIEKDKIKYVSGRIAVTRFAGILEKKFGFENGTGTGGDDAAAQHYLDLAENEEEKDTIRHRASKLVASLSESSLIEQAVREVAALLCSEESVNGAAIREILTRIIPPEEKPPL